MKKFDKTAVSVIIITILAILAVVIFSRVQPISVMCVSSDDCTKISPYGGLRFEFSKPVSIDALQRLFTVSPPAEGRWTLTDGQHATWVSMSPMSPGSQITYGFLPGVIGENGGSIRQKISWKAEVRSPRVAYLKVFTEGYEIYTIDPDQPGEEIRFSTTDHNVYDFSISLDGEWIAYSALNPDGGVDLWIQGRTDTQAEKILDCGFDHCTTPAWAPSGDEILFTREKVLTKGGNQGVPRIWILDVAQKTSSQLFSDDQIIGYGAEFSPDGKWIHYWDGIGGGIQLFNISTGSGFLVESQSGEIGKWTSDSRYLYYSDIKTGIYGYRSILYRVDVETRQVDILLGGNDDPSGASYDRPVLDQTNQKILASVQRNVKIPGRELEVYDQNLQPVFNISNDLSMIFSQYSWSTDSSKILMCGDLLTDMQDGGVIRIIDISDHSDRTILEDGGTNPMWLP